MNAHAQNIMEARQNADAIGVPAFRDNSAANLRADARKQAALLDVRTEATASVLEIARASGYPKAVLVAALIDVEPDLAGLLGGVRSMNFSNIADEGNCHASTDIMDAAVKLYDMVEASQ